MDGGFGIRWPLSPIAAAAALGAALLSICFAIWSRELKEEVSPLEQAVPATQEPVEKDFQSRSAQSTPVIRVRDLDLRWGVRKTLLSTTVHSSFLDIRDASTSEILRGDFWNRSIEWRGDNELRRSAQKSIDEIRQEFIPVHEDAGASITEGKSEREGIQPQNCSPSRILDSYFRRSLRGRNKDSFLKPFRETKTHFVDYSWTRDFSSLPNLFSVRSKLQLSPQLELYKVKPNKAMDANYRQDRAERVVYSDQLHKPDLIAMTEIELDGCSLEENESFSDASKITSELKGDNFKETKQSGEYEIEKCYDIKPDDVTGSYYNRDDQQRAKSETHFRQSEEMSDIIARKGQMDQINLMKSNGNFNFIVEDNLRQKTQQMETHKVHGMTINNQNVESSNYHPSQNVSYLSEGGVDNDSSHHGVHLKSVPSVSQRYAPTDDAFISNICLNADIDSSKIKCDSPITLTAAETQGGELTGLSMDIVTGVDEHLEQGLERGADPHSIAGEQSDMRGEVGSEEIVVSQVDHLALESSSVTTVKGSVRSDADVTREEEGHQSRDGTIWGVSADDQPSVVVVGERSMDAEEDPLDAIVRDLHGICDDFRASNGNVRVRKSPPSEVKSKVIEVSSVSECSFLRDHQGTIESTLSLETSSEDSGTVHHISSTFRDHTNGDISLSHRIETSGSSETTSIEPEGVCRFRPVSASSPKEQHSVMENSPEKVQRAETPPLSRLMVLLDRDQERREKSKHISELVKEPVPVTKTNGISNEEINRELPGKPMNGSSPHDRSHTGKEGEESTSPEEVGDRAEWDALMRHVLASVSELERWEKETAAERRSDRSTSAELPSSLPPHSTSGEHAMEEKVAVTPTKVKNLRFKLDPDVYDVPSDDSFYDDDDQRKGRPWRKHHQTKYQTFSALDLGKEDPVQLVSVRTSVVSPGQKMVVRPVVGATTADEARMRLKQLDIDLHIRLEGEESTPQTKRGHHGSGSTQSKRKSPVSERTGWCQELSPVSENVDWRETWSAITPTDNPPSKVEPVRPNGILKTSPRTEIVIDKVNPFKETENHVVSPKKDVSQNGVVSPVKSKPAQNGVPPPRKLFLPRKKFVPDPEAIERITGYKVSLTKPPLPPPPINRSSPSPRLGGTAKKRTDSARKHYFDHRATLSASKVLDSSNQKFQQFLSQAQNDRARIVTSSPDLVAIEQAVKTQWLKEKNASSQKNTSSEQLDTRESTPSRSTTPDDVWSGYVQMCRRNLNRRSRSLCYLETDIDALMGEDDKAVSLTTLNEQPLSLPARLEPKDAGFDESVEDLIDSGHAKSEHEIRVEKSLRNLSLPDWYRKSDKPKTGFLLGSSNAKEKRGWAAAKSLASSTSSLTSCGNRRPRPIRSLRSSQENITWSRGSVSPAELDHGLGRNGPALSLALARAFREPYLGWRARTPSSGVSSSPQVDLSPPSWVADSCDTPLTSDLPPMDEEAVSFDGEDVILVNTSSEPPTREENGDTCEDVITMSMDTCEGHRDLPGEDTCDDINNMSMDTCELFPPATNGDQKSSPLAGDDTCDDVRNISSDTAGLNGHPSPLNTGDDINNLSTDASESQDDSSVRNGDSSSKYQSLNGSSKRSDMKRKRYSYSQSIYHSEWDEGKKASSTRESSPVNKIIWIESSFVGSRTTTSIVVLPTQSDIPEHSENGLVRPASR